MNRYSLFVIAYVLCVLKLILKKQFMFINVVLSYLCKHWKFFFNFFLSGLKTEKL